eukprot:1146653-Pelagomonas_calceolata.AAC.5
MSTCIVTQQNCIYVRLQLCMVALSNGLFPFLFLIAAPKLSGAVKVAVKAGRHANVGQILIKKLDAELKFSSRYSLLAALRILGVKASRIGQDRRGDAGPGAPNQSCICASSL